MTKRVQRYGLTSAAMAVLTGLEREFIVNIDDWSIHVQDGVTAGGHKISTDVENANTYQPKSAELTAIAGLGTTGIVARTGAHTYTPRTITGTANQIVVTNGDGVAGDPSLAFASPVTLTSPIFATSMKLPFSIDHGGRLTLVSGAPVMSSDQTAKSSIFFTPAKNNMIVGYDGANIVAQAFSELTLLLNATDNTSGNIYDIWYDVIGGVLGTGPAWTTATAGSGARGTGAGTTEFEMFNGMRVNKNAITLRANGASLGSKAVRTCILLGSAYMTANGQTGVAFKPAAATGGSNAIVGLSNAINRVPVISYSRDNTAATYPYAIATWRQMNNSNNNRVSWLDTLGEITIKALTSIFVDNAVTGFEYAIGIKFNATSGTPAGRVSDNLAGAATNSGMTPIAGDDLINLGFNYAQAMEIASTGTPTLFCIQAGAQYQMTRIELEM